MGNAMYLHTLTLLPWGVAWLAGPLSLGLSSIKVPKVPNFLILSSFNGVVCLA